MQYNIGQIVSIINAELTGTSDRVINWLLTDSRSLSFPEDTLFFAIHTTRNDGHHYIPDLYKRGTRAFVVEKLPEDIGNYADASFLKVENSLEALQKLASACRAEFHIPVIGITGSNGKTIVKEWLNQLLSPFLRIVRSPRSYNSQIGVPLSVWLLNGQAELGVFEAGISEYGEMESLQKIIQPTIGVFTNLGTAHQENFTSLEEKCMEKLKLFEDVDVLIYNADSEIIRKCVQLKGLTQGLSWSKTDASAELYIRKIRKVGNTTEVTYVFKERESSIVIPFISDASIENVIHCLAVCLYLQIPEPSIQERMKKLVAVAMRLEVVEAQNGCVLINDSYNSDIQSLDIALDFMNRRPDSHGKSCTLI